VSICLMTPSQRHHQRFPMYIRLLSPRKLQSVAKYSYRAFEVNMDSFFAHWLTTPDRTSNELSAPTGLRQ
jgi:hypothetical protein